jgi:four helix bundle protein
LRVASCGLQVAGCSAESGIAERETMKNYKDLEIYQLSYELAIKVHKMSLKLPKYEIFEEGSQLRRSSKGITSTIVEGYGRRRYKLDFIKFLVYAHASCDETILHLNFIRDTHDIAEKDSSFFLNEYEKLGRKINKFIQYVEKEWK